MALFRKKNGTTIAAIEAELAALKERRAALALGRARTATV
jgi:hypothetical protein